MIEGHFNNKGELFLQMDLMATDSSFVTADAMLDTDFTDWLAMNIQDIESLGWAFIKTQKKYTASGLVRFSLYAGTVFFMFKKSLSQLSVVRNSHIREYELRAHSHFHGIRYYTDLILSALFY
ncbi:MAG: aspartyl protease [Candidatus Parabeggiatoa sp. nov. 1]|nr:MAG: aspartyl protease [Gammaproteobacteria bacterium]